MDQSPTTARITTTTTTNAGTSNSKTITTTIPSFAVKTADQITSITTISYCIAVTADHVTTTTNNNNNINNNNNNDNQ